MNRFCSTLWLSAGVVVSGVVSPSTGLAQAASTGIDSARVLDEIIVTAQKRAENVQEVPISITALSGGQLTARGVTSTNDLPSVAPGLLFTQGNNFAQPTIRGIGTSSTALGDESSIAIFVDGVYYPAATGTLFDLLDVQSIEVLRGPQGTLFGRNATGGAIRITTHDPASETRGNVELTYGNYDRIEAKGSYSMGSSDGRIGGSVAFLIGRNESFIRNVADGRHLSEDTRELVRGKLKFAPSDRFTALLAADYGHIVSARSLVRTVLNGNATGIALGSPNPGRYEVAANPGGNGIVEQYGTSMRATIHFDNVDFVSISGYRHNEALNMVDADFTAAPILGIHNIETNETFSQELQLISTGMGSLN